jgi:hypothetical protein
MATTPLATPDDVVAVWRPLTTDDEWQQVETLITKASAKLRQACPFDIDERIAQWAVDPTVTVALDPVVVADVVATVVKRFLVNVEGVASSSETVGPYSRSATFVNRYDKTGSDVRGAIQITESDIDQLRPKVPAVLPSTFSTGVPHPEILVPSRGRRNGDPLDPFTGGAGPFIVPDFGVGTGTE